MFPNFPGFQISWLEDSGLVSNVRFLTLPISEVHDTTIVFGTVVDSLTSDVMLMGRLGRLGSTPFLVGGR